MRLRFRVPPRHKHEKASLATLSLSLSCAPFSLARVSWSVADARVRGAGSLLACHIDIHTLSGWIGR